MRDYLERWLYDPVVGKLIAAAIGIVVIYVLVAFVHKAATRYVTDSETRYRARKLTVFLGYAAGFLLLASIFSDRFGQLTVALGVAGAGIAFRLAGSHRQRGGLGGHFLRSILPARRSRASGRHHGRRN